MSIQTAVSTEYLSLRLLRLLKRSALRLGRLVCDALGAYGDAASVAYTMTLGLDRKQEPTLRERDY